MFLATSRPSGLEPGKDHWTSTGECRMQIEWSVSISEQIRIHHNRYSLVTVAIDGSNIGCVANIWTVRCFLPKKWEDFLQNSIKDVCWKISFLSARTSNRMLQLINGRVTALDETKQIMSQDRDFSHHSESWWENLIDLMERIYLSMATLSTHCHLKTWGVLPSGSADDLQNINKYYKILVLDPDALYEPVNTKHGYSQF